jgi:diguanylate cyclase (GGDEF)-like protein/hemerythrin-like metal-binding protein
MKSDKLFKGKNNKAIGISFLVGIVLLLLLTSFLFSLVRNDNQMKTLHVTQNYNKFDDKLQGFFIYNSNFIKGFTAYIQTFDQYNDEDVYSYIGHLLDNNLDYIRNMGILKDTTIMWNYPKEENENTIGVDLLKIPSQSDAIMRTKETLKYNFEGPIQLVQGGTGYVMRIPIIKNEKYWGIVSIVLKADKVKEMFENYEKESKIKVAILNNSSNNSLVYGKKSILSNKKAVMFHSGFSGGDWNIYVLPIEDKGLVHNKLFVFITFMGLLLTPWISYQSYKYILMNEEMKKKNKLLSLDIVKDKLTGIYNRNYLDSRIIEEVERVNRHGGSLSMIYFDLDHFKTVNDTYGHRLGDAVLKEVTRVVAGEIRNVDIFARWGGEEFAIIVPDTTLAGAKIVAEKLRVALENVVHPVVGKVTTSFGVAEYIVDEYIGSWFNRADTELYFSKMNGRNRVSGKEVSKTDKSVQVKVKWSDDWLCGNNAINQEHKKLLELGNEMVENSYKFSKQEEIIQHVSIFFTYMVEHFETEEMILKSIDYEHYQHHKETHKKLIKIFNDLKKELEDTNAKPEGLLNFVLNDMLIGHIEKEDLTYFQSLKKS